MTTPPRLLPVLPAFFGAALGTALCAAALVGTSGTARGQATFEAPVTLRLPGASRHVVAGDLDGDGHLDLLASPWDIFLSSGQVQFLRGVGDGTFEAPVPSAGTGCDVLSLHDMDGDGVLDLFALDYLQVGGPLVLRLGQGDGSFAGGQVLSAGLEPTAAAPGDFDGDGRPDVVILSTPPTAFPGGVYTALGHGDGSFEPPSSLAPANTGFVAAADLDGDGLDDVVFTRVDAFVGTVQTEVYLSQGDGSFVLATPSAPLPITGARSMRTGDVDGDGDVDVVVGFKGGFGGAAEPPTVYAQLNDGTGLLDTVIASPDSTGGGDHRLGDVDGDGVLDVVSFSAIGGAGPEVSPVLAGVKVLRGQGDGRFEPELAVTLAELGFGFALGDFDEDGRTDVAAAQAVSGVALLHNHTYAPRGPYAELGDALPGGVGYPILLGEGATAPGEPFAWNLYNALPGAPLYLIVGTSLLDLPFKGGVLKPFPTTILGPLPAPPEGTVLVSGTTPNASGLLLVLQWWIVDADGKVGLAASNGLAMTLP